MTQTSILLAALAFIVLAEAINKLFRTRPCLPGITPHERLLEWLKALAWGLLAVGAFLAWLDVFLHPTNLSPLRELCTTGGFVVLIIRTRFKEG